jgi:GxxExxY protein
MPFSTPYPIRNLTITELDGIDFHVMKAAYAAQNHLGRLCHEQLYERDMVEALRGMNIGTVDSQVPILAVHGSFSKEYLLDLVVNHAVFELKAASGFNVKHFNQVFHYGAMLAINYIKLLNFRPSSVVGERKYNVLMPEVRYQPNWHTADFKPLSESCDRLYDVLKSLVADWGTHLDVTLYKESLVHFMSGPGLGDVRLPVYRGDVVLGSQQVHTHHSGVLFAVTAFENTGTMAKQLQRITANARQRGMQWINLHGSDITIETIVP